MTHPAVFDAAAIKRFLSEPEVLAIKGDVKFFIRSGTSEQYRGMGYEVRPPTDEELEVLGRASEDYAREMSAAPVRD